MIPGPMQWVKDLAFPQLLLKFDPWPRNYHVPWVQPKIIIHNNKANLKEKKKLKGGGEKNTKNNRHSLHG